MSMWKKHFTTNSQSNSTIALDPVAERKLVERLKAFTEAPSAPEVFAIPNEELDSVSIERLVPPRRGSWWVVPKAIAEKE